MLQHTHTPTHTFTHTNTHYKDNHSSRPLDCRFLIGCTIIQRQGKDKDAAEKPLFTPSRSWPGWRSDLTYSKEYLSDTNTLNQFVGSAHHASNGPNALQS